MIDAINQVFALFRINYHNQFYAAFSDTTLLDQAKRLWLETLGNFGEGIILAAARSVIEQSEYLPTINKMLDACDQQLITLGIPGAREAYLEACNAPGPKIVQSWSHPAVYHAGKATGWYRLAHQTEKTSWPEYQKHYREFCQKALSGDDLTIDRPPALDKPHYDKLNPEEKREKMRELREKIGL